MCSHRHRCALVTETDLTPCAGWRVGSSYRFHVEVRHPEAAGLAIPAGQRNGDPEVDDTPIGRCLATTLGWPACLPLRILDTEARAAHRRVDRIAIVLLLTTQMRRT
jgi:hypothetical protein